MTCIDLLAAVAAGAFTGLSIVLILKSMGAI